MENQFVAYANIFANVNYKSALGISSTPKLSAEAFDDYKKHESEFPEITEYVKHPRFSDELLENIFYNHEDLPYSVDFNLAKDINIGELVSYQVFNCLDNNPIQNLIFDHTTANGCLFLLTSKGYRTKSIINLRFEAIHYELVKEAKQDLITGKWSCFRSLEAFMDQYLSSFEGLDYYKVLSTEEIERFEGKEQF